MEPIQNVGLFFLLLAGLPKVCDTEGYCSFPRYLWEPLSDGSPRKWISKTEYFRNTLTWEKQREITVMETEIMIQHKVHASCKGYETESAVPCFRQDIVYEIICVSLEPDGKFRVQQKVNGKKKFNCLQFVRRRKNIIQVYSAVPREVNEDRLCYDVALQRDEWPWLDPSTHEWQFCPFSGGFDLRLFEGEMRQRACPEEWRSSRLESECIRGEGATFYFPRDTCSPFADQVLEQTLYCWGDWVEASYRFILMAERGSIPRFVLRLPKDIEGVQGKFTGFLYFSLVVPISGRGNPPGNVLFLELRTQRSEAGRCYDEGEQCSQYAREGKCTNSALHQYANFCMLSCGLCDFAPSERPECRFPANFHGTWVNYDTDVREDMTFEPGQVTSSNLGQFICKSKHWEYDYYKVLSVYKNGCRPRFSCMHIEEEKGILQYRLSRSALSDQSFKICEFNDDPYPPGKRIRSAKMKTLLPLNSLQFGSCGLGGIVHVNTTFSDWLSCEGTMADIDYLTCEVQELLRLQLYQCRGNKKIEFICEAYAHLPSGVSFIVTKPADVQTTEKYWCWIVKADGGRKSTKPWREAYLFSRAVCSTGEIFRPLPKLEQLTTIESYDDLIESPCGHLKSPGFDRPFSKLMSSSSQLAPQPVTNSPSAQPTNPVDVIDSAPSRRRKQEYRNTNTKTTKDDEHLQKPSGKAMISSCAGTVCWNLEAIVPITLFILIKKFLAYRKCHSDCYVRE